MNQLENIKKYDEYCSLNENLLGAERKEINRAFLKGEPIVFADGSSVKREDIVRVVTDAIQLLADQYTRTFEFANRTLNIIYLAHSAKYDTMAVDKNMNLYLNAGFVYNVLKMDPELIAAVIMHEVFHALFKHIERGENWLAANGKSKTASTWHDTNLAADIEVNQSLVKANLITEERLINEIKGLYLKNKDFQGTRTNVLTMEMILNDEDMMRKLREMCPDPDDPETRKQNTIKTTPEWNQGYKDAWNQIAGLIKKYGYKDVWKKLQDAGLINSVGEIDATKSIEDIKALAFIQVKSFDDYINENLNQPKEDKGQTYDDGFVTAFGKLINQLESAINQTSGGGMEGGGSQGGDYYDTDLKDEDLDEIELPGQNGGEGGGDNGLPDNIKSNNNSEDGQGSDDNQDGGGGDDSKSDSQQQSKSAGKGGKGKSADELTDDDINKLADDLEKKTKGGEDKISTSQEVSSGSKKSNSIGNTGSFQSEGLTDSELEEAGYSGDELKKIKEIIKANEEKNTPARLQKEIDSWKREIKDYTYLGKLLKAIDVDSAKYKNVWKQILERFLAKRTRRAGKDTPTGSNDWKHKKSIARGEYGIHHRMASKEPQDVNFLIDVSGSVDTELLEVISKSLVIYAKEFKYSGLNIAPWASTVNGVTTIEGFYKKGEDVLTDEIMEAISAGIAQCGGGTDAKAAMGAIIETIEETLKDPKKKLKDDVHIVITDGYFDYQGIESRLGSAVKSYFDRPDVGDRVVRNTVWMLYNTDDRTKEAWSNEIKNGTLIFLNSEVVKNNG